MLGDHRVLLEGNRIAAVTPSRPPADIVFDRPGRFVLPGLLNLYNHSARAIDPDSFTPLRP